MRGFGGERGLGGVRDFDVFLIKLCAKYRSGLITKSNPDSGI
jgi:CHAD domain-containing protein